MPECYIATFLRHSKQYLENGTVVDVLVEDDNPHQGEKGDLETITSWRQPGEELKLTQVKE